MEGSTVKKATRLAWLNLEQCGLCANFLHDAGERVRSRVPANERSVSKGLEVLKDSKVM